MELQNSFKEHVVQRISPDALPEPSDKSTVKKALHGLTQPFGTLGDVLMLCVTLNWMITRLVETNRTKVPLKIPNPKAIPDTPTLAGKKGYNSKLDLVVTSHQYVGSPIDVAASVSSSAEATNW
jgi:hypothetical protein